MGIIPQQDLARMGFLHVGGNVSISDRASFYGLSRISIGDNSRIDDYCVISAGVGGVSIGKHVHIAVYSSLIGAGRITLGDFANISSRVAIYSSSDDFSGSSMTNPTVPEQYKNVLQADVTLGRHSIVGCGSVILPGVTLGVGAAIGALSLVRSSCEEFSIYAGNPLKRIRDRDRKLLLVESAFMESAKNSA